MSTETKKSEQVAIRFPIDHTKYLKQKAKDNPSNTHNYVATEVKALVAADFERAQRSKKK